MKGLTLTMEIVIIAIVLLVTALVIMTIFGGSIASFLGILNPWSASLMEQNLCNQRCAAWCQGHLGSPEVSWADTSLRVQTQSGEQSCSAIMSGLSDKCSCRTITTSNTCSLRCNSGQENSQTTGQSSCETGKTCRVTCPSTIPSSGIDATGTCS